jgi:hypothetical protein
VSLYQLVAHEEYGNSIVVSGDLAALADRELVKPIPVGDPILSGAGLASYDGKWSITYLPDEG